MKINSELATSSRYGREDVVRRRSNQTGEGQEFNPRKVANRIANADIPDEDKRALIGRLKNYVQGQNGEESSRRDVAQTERARVRRAAIDIA